MNAAMAKTDAQVRNVRQVWMRFFLYAFGAFLVYSAYGTLLSLQSSINVVDGLGTTCLAAIYASAVVFSVLFVPAILRKYEAKKCVCYCEITYIVYTAANFYPNFYTMLPASVIVGMGDCVLWACFPIMNTFFANLYSSASRQTVQQSHEARFSGYFFAIFQMAKISGNLISYAVLYGFNQSYSASNVSLMVNNTELSTPVEMDQIHIIDYSHCGANDCQDAEQVDATITQYVPPNDWALYVLLIVMTLLCVGAVVVHAIFIPNTEEFLSVRRRRSSVGLTGIRKNPDITGSGISKNMSKSSLLRHNSIAKEEKENNNCKPVRIDEEINVSLTKEEEVQQDALASVDENVRQNNDVKSASGAWFGGIKTVTTQVIYESIVRFIFTTAKDVAIQMFEIKQLLLMPMIFYVGLDFGFITSELTRSYTSCVFGVSWVTIHSLFFGVGAATVCYVTGKLSKYLSRNTLLSVAALCDTTMYLYIRFWNPQEASHISLIPVYFLLGGMNGGIWIPVSQVLQVVTFPDRLDVSSPVWNFWFMSGIGAQFAWSTSMCVDAKIYIQLGLLVISVLGYGISEKLRRSEVSVKEENAL